MAELLMNSAIPSEGSMRTSWPRLRNRRCAKQSKKGGITEGGLCAMTGNVGGCPIRPDCGSMVHEAALS